MKKLVWLCALIVSLPVLANPLHGELKNFNLNYEQPSGQAESELLIFRDIVYQQKTSYEVELQAGSLFLITPMNTFQIDNLPAFISDVETLNVEQLDLNSSTELLGLSLKSFYSKSLEESMTINELKITCTSLQAAEDAMSEILHQCLNNTGEVSLESFYEGSKKQLSNFTMTTQNSSMSFRVSASGITVRGEGETYFEGEMVRIKITKARAGFLNVKGRLFRELQAIASESVRVNNPWIEIDL